MKTMHMQITHIKVKEKSMRITRKEVMLGQRQGIRERKPQWKKSSIRAKRLCLMVMTAEKSPRRHLFI